MKRAAALTATATALALLLSGCTESTDLGTISDKGDNRNYISGNGAITEYHDRSRSVTFSGPTVDGKAFRSSDYRGKVLVVNFWYAGCPPCRAEAPSLQRLWRHYSGRGVQFIGVNVRDEAGPAAAFARQFKVTYPSILDAGSGSVQYAFSRDIPANAVPTTLVLDQQGRVAARIVGQLQAPSILSTLIDDTLDGRE